MFKKSIAALFVGTAVLMTACGGNAATTAPETEAPAASTETAPETEAPAASTETAPEAAETAASVPAEAAGTEERAAAQIETELTDGVLDRDRADRRRPDHPSGRRPPEGRLLLGILYRR